MNREELDERVRKMKESSPKRKDFETDEAYEMAKIRWQQTVGRNLGLAKFVIVSDDYLKK